MALKTLTSSILVLSWLRILYKPIWDKPFGIIKISSNNVSICLFFSRRLNNSWFNLSANIIYFKEKPKLAGKAVKVDTIF